jgi:hypothetical protein
VLLWSALTALLFAGCNTADPCINVSCLNYGLCANGTCVCVGGYEGENCELRIRDRLLGTYEGQEVCTDVAPYSYPLFIAEGTEGGHSIVIGNFANRVIGVKANIESGGIVIPLQTIQVQSGSVTVDGLATISDSTLFFYFTLVDRNVSTECNLTVPFD